MKHELYESPVSSRYGDPDMLRIWGEYNKRLLWREVWLQIALEQHRAGIIDDMEIGDILQNAKAVYVNESLRVEARTRHDLVAELEVFQGQCHLGGKKLHLGATSSDITDNADAMRIRDSARVILRQLDELIEAMVDKVGKYANVPCVGFTHLQRAEITTVGYRLAFYLQDTLASRNSIHKFSNNVYGKGLGGAVGTAANFSYVLQGTDVTMDEMEDNVMNALGLHWPMIKTQTYPRGMDLQIMQLLSAICSSLHKMAFDFRLLQSPLAGEWGEGFGHGQVGSSAMPFKKNPISAENICSITRQVSHMVQTAWDNEAWAGLERTLDDSANRRSMLPDAFILTDAALIRATALVHELVLDGERIRRNLEGHLTMANTETLMLRMVMGGKSRREAREIIDDNIKLAGRWPDKLRERLKGDERTGVPPSVTDAILSEVDVGRAAEKARNLVILATGMLTGRLKEEEIDMNRIAQTLVLDLEDMDDDQYNRVEKLAREFAENEGHPFFSILQEPGGGVETISILFTEEQMENDADAAWEEWAGRAMENDEIWDFRWISE